MIYPKTYYEASCDSCGTRWEDDCIVAYPQKEFVIDSMEASEWQIEGDKHYCPDCKSILSIEQETK
jgi:hypothetical protein